MSFVADGSVFRETFTGLVCGVAFGVTSPIVSHPLDLLKTRMQAIPGASSCTQTFLSILREGGPRSLYNGLSPPLLGSMLYRSIQMSAYGGTYSALRDSEFWSTPRSTLGGLQLRVLAAGACATTARAVIETPLELIKVRRQLSLTTPIHPKALFTGFSLTWSRLYVALGGFFCLVDHCERHYPWLFSIPVYGSFIKGAVCATAAWWVAWPLEVVKNRYQSSLHAGNSLQILVGVVKEGGIRGLYRGILPGTARSVIGNGSALLAYDICKSLLVTDGPAKNS